MQTKLRIKIVDALIAECNDGKADGYFDEDVYWYDLAFEDDLLLWVDGKYYRLKNGDVCEMDGEILFPLLKKHPFGIVTI